MQFSDLDNNDHKETKCNAVYENSSFITSSAKPATELQTTSEDYEVISFDTKQDDCKIEKEEIRRDSIQWKDLPKQIKYINYTFSVMLAILYIIVIAAVVAMALLKGNDGTWSDWESWGSCSESCDGGVKSRFRTCTNARLSILGKECKGSSQQVELCNRNSCEDGTWSDWESWGSCSESCDGGVKSRLRTCRNPRLSILGKECKGSSQQVELCNRNSCEDGTWSDWESWGSCSESCDGGVKSRLRTCRNPRLSILGKECKGSSQQVELCNRNSCEDSVWSNWGTWGSCSKSCGGGAKSRLRTCTNPKTSLFGRDCEGSSEQVVLCNRNTCDDHKVAFLAYGSSNEEAAAVLRFPRIRINYGNGYNLSTGRFTCKISGIYNLAVTLTKQRRDIDLISAYLRINATKQLFLHADPSDAGDIDKGSYSLSATGNFHLNTSDYVDVYSVPFNFYDDSRTSFTGVLVIPDN